MKKKNSRIKNQKNKGITLIALIITIIILLILAGVSINMVLGKNGLLNNSKEATQKYKDSQGKEELSLILSDYYMAKIQDDNIDLETYLNKNNATLKAEQGENYIIEYNGNEYTIQKNSIEGINEPQQVIVTENGEERTITVADMARDPKKYYGARVTNYTQGASYRIFYIDTENKYGDGANTVYLIADYDGSRTSALGTIIYGTYTAYEYDASKTRIRQMNPMWENYIENLPENNWNENAKAVAYLCDTSKWTAYYDNTQANYVIGAPSMEMYVNSYNQTHNANSLVYTCTTTEGTNSINSGNGYFIGANGRYSNNGYWTDYNTAQIDTTQNQIYMMNAIAWTWLASPSALGTYSVSLVSGWYASLDSCREIGAYGVRPLVSLKSNVPIKIEL